MAFYINKIIGKFKINLSFYMYNNNIIITIITIKILSLNRENTHMNKILNVLSLIENREQGGVHIKAKILIKRIEESLLYKYLFF